MMPGGKGEKSPCCPAFSKWGDGGIMKDSKKSGKAAGFFKWIGRDIADIGVTFKEGDWKTRISYLIMGFGPLMRKMYARGIAFLALEAAFIWYMVAFGWDYLAKFTTLGTVETGIDMKTGLRVYGDNSFMILLYGLLTIVLLLLFIFVWRMNIRENRNEEQKLKEGHPLPTLRQDLHSLLDSNFDKTLLALPVAGIFLFTVLPILFMVCVAFTNYDYNHQAPSKLFTWVGLENFKNLFSFGSAGFGSTFFRVLGWTLIWAFFATFLNYFVGMAVAILINKKGVKFKKLWRTILVMTIAVPQFVSLLLLRNFFANNGIANTFCSSIGLTDLLKNLGWITTEYIPFLTDPVLAKITIVVINIWVGVPYLMLIATGVLINIPEELKESAKIDGANAFQIFRKITMPYMLFITGPYLVTQFTANINNFNVIYLLTQDIYTTTNQKLAASQGKEIDLLVTWLYRLTSEQYNYKMAAVIGICVFVVCTLVTLFAFNFLIKGDKEDTFR